MHPYYSRAVLKGHRLDAPAYGIVEPPLKILTYCLILGVEDEPAVPVGHRLGELLGCLLARLAVDCPALGAGGRLNRVASHVKPALLVTSDAPLAVAASTHRPLPSSTHEAQRQVRRPVCVSCGVAPAVCRFRGGLWCRKLSPSCAIDHAERAHVPALPSSTVAHLLP